MQVAKDAYAWDPAKARYLERSLLYQEPGEGQYNNLQAAKCKLSLQNVCLLCFVLLEQLHFVLLMIYMQWNIYFQYRK